jgi:hypothetical protein
MGVLTPLGEMVYGPPLCIEVILVQCPVHGRRPINRIIICEFRAGEPGRGSANATL